MQPIIVWFRRDLRIKDNPALFAAAARGAEIVPLFVWAPEEEAPWPSGAASRSWLHYSLQSLQTELRGKGVELTLRRGGSSLEVLRALVRETGARSVYFNRLYEPQATSRDNAIREALRADGIEVESFKANLLVEPWEMLNSSGKPFLVFTPYWKKLSSTIGSIKPLKAPRTITVIRHPPQSLNLEELGLRPQIEWDRGFYRCWMPGENGAKRRLSEFTAKHLGEYAEARDIMAVDGTSGLSPHLHFGEISPRQIWDALKNTDVGILAGVDAFLRQLAWREFGHQLLFHYPHTAQQPLRSEFANFPWRSSKALLHAWQKGETGYPLVDAAMRQLWSQGWMHNRARLVAASFLVKDLLIPWHDGASWFWDTLIDADLSNNTLGWQWTAGCGADAAPYFRVFNPVLQGKRFDPAGEYVRRFVPELGRMSSRWIHEPWASPEAELKRAGVVLGVSYPRPIVDHAEAKAAALEAYEAMKER